MFSVNFDGSLQQSYAFTSVSTEPTGVAFDPATGRLYVSDDDANKVYVVDQANPTVKLAEFSTDTFGSTRTSDITMAPDGNLFILDQATRTIYQTTTDGTLVRSEEHTYELQSLKHIQYASFRLKTNTTPTLQH